MQSVKKILFNMLLVLCSLFFVAALTETFFYFNSIYNFIKPERRPEYHGASSAIPENFLKEYHKIYPPAPNEKEFHEKIETLAKQSRVRRYTYGGGPVVSGILTDHMLTDFPPVIREISEVQNVKIYDASYNFNHNKIRKSGAEERPQNKNILLLGCSFTFGVGLEDSKTITGQLAKMRPGYNLYNLGVPGGGLTNALEDAYFKDRLSKLNKNGGAVVYIYWWDHFRRFFKNVDQKIATRVQFELKDNELVRSKPFSNVPAWLYPLINSVEKSFFLKFVGYGQDVLSIENQDKFLDFIVYLQDFYKTNYNLDFYFYILNPQSIPSKYFVDGLIKRNIKFISYKQVDDVLELYELSIPADGHFTEKANFLFAKEIHETLLKH